MTKNDEFDCVEMKRAGGERVNAATRGMTIEQQAEYWKRQTEELRRAQEDARMKRSRKSA